MDRKIEKKRWTSGRIAFLIGAIAWTIALFLAARGAGKMKRERLLGVASEI